MLRHDVHLNPAAGLSRGIVDLHEGQDAAVVELEALDEAVLALGDPEFGDVPGDGDQVVFPVEEPPVMRPLRSIHDAPCSGEGGILMAGGASWLWPSRQKSQGRGLRALSGARPATSRATL